MEIIKHSHRWELNLPEPSAIQTGPAIIAVHGRGSDPDAFLNLPRRLGWMELPIMEPLAEGRSWYPQGFKAPLSDNQPGIANALEAVDNARQGLHALGFQDHQIILIGFSQGACVAVHYALMNPTRYKGVFALTGGYIGPDGEDWGFEGDLQRTPVMITTSEEDQWVPLRRVEETEAELKRLNAHVHKIIYKDRPHAVSDDEIQRIREMMPIV
ncbi:MAG: dienelactone hydrolase family protein [Bacteroidota bacterium]